MRHGDSVRLSCQPRGLRDYDAHILTTATGRAVLNVGAAGGVFDYLPRNMNAWMHYKLMQVVASLDGIDIDEEGIRHAAKHGFHIQNADCEKADLGKQYDLILLSDVIEHVESPSRALVNLHRHLKPEGKLVITTPNATGFGILSRALLRWSPEVYWDHMAIFLPEHIQAICDRHGINLESVCFFTFHDSRTTTNRFKSRLTDLIGSFNPRLHSTFLACIRNRASVDRIGDAE